MADLLQERVDLAQTHAKEKDIRLDVSLAANPVLPFDGKRIAQVMDNLLSNALKFSPQGSEVSVVLLKEGGQAVVRINDKGPGVKVEEESLLFGAFAQLSAQPTGGENSSGLGLAICKSIIDAHEGQIGYKRVEGGSCFYFGLPL